jgi:L-iditol 2-dehydrogenase
VRTAFESVRPGGRVVLGGIPDSDATTFRASLARRKGLTIAMVRRMNEVYPRAIDLAARGVVALDRSCRRVLRKRSPASLASSQ